MEFITPVEITPSVAGSWQNVDVSAYVPVGTTGVALHIVNTHSTNGWAIGFRKNGSTDNRTNAICYNSHFWTAIGVDTNRILQLYVGDTTYIDVYLVGYWTTDAVFFTNAIDKTPSTANAWVDINISAETGTDTVLGAIFELTGLESFDLGLRNNGSTDNYTGSVATHCGAIIGVDSAKICEGYTADTTNGKLFLVGYIKSNAIFYVNSLDYTITTANTWYDLPALPAGAKGGFFMAIGAGITNTGLRKNGSTENITRWIYNGLGWGIIECDTNGIVEGFASGTPRSLYLVGYPGIKALSISDSGSGIETLAIKNQLSVLDNGSGVDSILKIPVLSVVDSGIGTEVITAKLVHLVQDSGIGQDLISAIKAKLTITDLGSGVDAILIKQFKSIMDSGIGVDTIGILAKILIQDSGVGTDIISILSKLLVQDSGIGVDLIKMVMQEFIQDSGIGIDTIYRKITFKPSIIDDEDFSKPIIVQEYRTIIPLPLWVNKPVEAGETSDEIDVSALGSFGILIKISSPTTVKVQIEAEWGWEDIDEIIFDAAGSQFYPFWSIQFQKVRLLFTQATTASMQLYCRT
jgi:hypothetical protein